MEYQNIHIIWPSLDRLSSSRTKKPHQAFGTAGPPSTYRPGNKPTSPGDYNNNRNMTVSIHIQTCSLGLADSCIYLMQWILHGYWKDKRSVHIFRHCRYSISVFILPLLVLAFTYASICLVIWNNTGIVGEARGTHGGLLRRRTVISRAKINSVKQMIAVISFYAASSSPFIASLLWVTWDPNAPNSPFFVGNLPDWLAA